MRRPSLTPSSPKPGRQRGQVLVIFAGSMVLLMLLMAVVVDVSYYWVNNLRAQRAADAAALAGVVWLPGCPDSTSPGATCAANNARDTALAEASKNGFTDPAKISTSVDPNNNRKLLVTINGSVGTYFMKVVGINSIPMSRNAKAEFILPVPMGSPQNYYGVGQFLGTTKTPHVSGGGTTTATGDTGWGEVAGGAPSGGQWTASPSGTIQAAVGSSDGIVARTNTNGTVQQWNNFALLTGSPAPIPTPATNQKLTILGIQVRLSNTYLSNTCNNSSISVDLSWNNGATGSWSTAIATPSLGTTGQTYILPATGGDTSTSAWGARKWGLNDFSDANFLVRLTAAKGSCQASRTLNVDQLEVRVYYSMDTTAPITTTYTYDENTAPTDIKDPVATTTTLAPQNFWGAIFTKGGVRQNGDYFAPATIGGSASGKYDPPPSPLVYSTTNANPTYDATGYDYTVDLTGAAAKSGQVQLFDPIFCATGANKTSGWYGAGDHWTTHGSSQKTDIAPVQVTFSLWKSSGDPYNHTNDKLVASQTYGPADKTLGDFSGSVGNPESNVADAAHNGIQNVGRADAQDCTGMAGHNEWIPLASGLDGGMYRVNVETSSQTVNAAVGAENLFAIWVGGSGGTARVYGGGRMAGYTQVGAAPQSFFLAQIEAVHAGKYLEIKLFDPGDVSGNARLYIKSPYQGSYNDASFTWTADAGCKPGVSEAACSGSGTYIQTAVGGKSSFDNSMITITTKLPNDYGTGGLTPSDPGNPNGEPGWWKIYYDVTNANDTTTWQVDIRGNPVHLVVP